MGYKTFRFEKNSKILLYGAAYQGNVIFERIVNAGGKVEGFIDARAEEIKQMRGTAVYTLEAAARKYKEDKTVIVVVAVKNVFEHSRIAAQLAKFGFCKVVYKPYSALKGTGTDEQIHLSEAYDFIVERGNCMDSELIETQPGQYMLPSKSHLISEQDENVVAYLPLTCLFQDKGNDEVDLNVLYLYPHIAFFRYLKGETQADYHLYIEYCEYGAKTVGGFETTDAWRKNVIKNRTEVYEEMYRSFMMETDFFHRNCPKAEWNEKGYFNLMSGKHRAAFFCANRLTHIPVKMKLGDYNQWINAPFAKKVFSFLGEEEIYELKAPIEHPYFYEYPCGAKSFYENIVFLLADTFSKWWYQSPVENFMQGKSIYLDLDDYGFISRYLRRIGCRVYDKPRNDGTIKQMLDETFYLSDVGKIDMQDEYDVAFLSVQDDSEIEKIQKEIFAKHWFFILESGKDKEIAGLRKVFSGLCNGKEKEILYKEGEKDV